MGRLLVLLIAMCLSATIAYTAAAAAATATSGGGYAKVLMVRGEVFVKSNSNQETTPLAIGEVVSENDVIATGDNGVAKIKLDDETIMVIGKNSKMKIPVLGTSASSTSIVRLISGKIRSQVRKLNNSEEGAEKEGEQEVRHRFFMVTANAAMGVRGTDFQVEFDERKQLTSLTTFSGVVAIAAVKMGASGISKMAMERELNKELNRQGDSLALVKKQQQTELRGASSSVPVPIRLKPEALKERLEVDLSKLLIKKSGSTTANPAQTQAQPQLQKREYVDGMTMLQEKMRTDITRELEKKKVERSLQEQRLMQEMERNRQMLEREKKNQQVLESNQRINSSIEVQGSVDEIKRKEEIRANIQQIQEQMKVTEQKREGLQREEEKRDTRPPAAAPVVTQRVQLPTPPSPVLGVQEQQSPPPPPPPPKPVVNTTRTNPTLSTVPTTTTTITTTNIPTTSPVSNPVSNREGATANTGGTITNTPGTTATTITTTQSPRVTK
ncbi:MAG: FecR domain-containing protein [Oligoflexia bacterium]|nr:FecR domain-containing protein [Oligoflexia bacterium]